MNNKIKSQEIAKMLFENDRLTLSKNKIYVPVQCFKFHDSIIFAKIAIDALSFYNDRKGLEAIPAKSIKSSLNNNNVSNIINKYNLHSDDLYISISIAEKYINEDLNYADLFYAYCQNFYDIDDYFSLKKKFFKYVPVVHSATERWKSENDIYAGGYCCEEHDGPYDQYLETQVKYYDMDHIKYKLNKITFISK